MPKEKVETNNVPEEKKVYDINSVLEKARKSRELDYENERHKKISEQGYNVLNKLKEYEKESYMNELFSKMSRIIASNPASYSEDEIKSALHSSFQDYLDSKNISLEEYEELMDKVIKAYAKEDKSEEEVASLLSKLNDAGTRDGGSR